MIPNASTASPQFKYSAGIALALLAASSFTFYCASLASPDSAAHQVATQILRLSDSFFSYDPRVALQRPTEAVREDVKLPATDSPFISTANASERAVLDFANAALEARDWDAFVDPKTPMGDSSKLHVHLTSPSLPREAGQIEPSEERISEIRDSIILRVGLLNAAVLIVLSLFGLYFWQRAASRLRAIKTTLTAFNAGATDRRVSFSGPIDSLYELAHAINETLDRTEALIKNLNYTSSDVAHNLKKPLTRLRQRLETMYDGEMSDDDFKNKIGEAITEIDSLAMKFEALLNIGQLQSGDHRSRFINVDLTRLLRQVIELYEPMIVDSWQKLETQIPAEPVGFIRGDRELLMEMLVNFVENAILHCPPGTKIRIALERSKSEIRITIADDGPGIPPSEIENVFRRFYRLDASRTKPGHGLGVPCSVAIAELHGAHITLSDNGPGLKVEIHFPTNSGKKLPELGLRPRSGLYVGSVLSPNTTEP
jgi:signal transduction histidine kinase